MKITYKDIDFAMDYYEIDKKKYKEKCYKCIDEINENIKILEKVNKIYDLLYIDKSDDYKKLWKIKNANEIFGQDYPKFITNIILLLGYSVNSNNMKKMNYCDSQIKIQKQRIKECFENDIINKNYDEIRISQMLWGTYFINNRLIETERLQFEPIEDNKVKIHIPAGEKLDIQKVIKSIKDSKKLLKDYFNLESPIYICESWLLSNEIAQMLNENSNIVKFQKLFNIKQDKNGIDDILNFVFNIKECNDYNQLTEKTLLQKNIKKFLCHGGTIYNGYGELKVEKLL